MFNITNNINNNLVHNSYKSNKSNNELEQLICNNFLTYLNVYCKKEKGKNLNLNCKTILEKYNRKCLDK